MNIKSLLLGSAAAMVAVSGAQAADAVVVEPEPVEYVRVCDAYGAGFFFIPGTETCIRLSGFVRSSFSKGYFDGTIQEVVATTITTTGGETDTTLTVAGVEPVDVSGQFWGQRARLDIDVRNETDWGTLRAQYRLEGGDSNTDANIDMDVALISLAGFRAGFAGANYWSSNHGFGNVRSEAIDTFTFVDGHYGFDDATILDYTFAADGFSVTIGAEDPRVSYSLSDGNGGFVSGLGLSGPTSGFTNTTNNGGPDGEVNFYAGFNWQGDLGGVAFTAAHDSTATEQSTGDIGGWAYKVSVNLDLSEVLPGASIAGYYLWDGDYDTDYVHTSLLTFNPEQIWGIGFDTDITDEIGFWANYWDAQGTDIGPGDVLPGIATGHAFGTTGDLRQFAVGINWFPSSAPGLKFDAVYYTGEIEDAIVPQLGSLEGNSANLDFDGFEVTVRRNF